MSATDDLLSKNTTFASDFADGHLGAPPARHLAVVTCMDARIDPAKLLGLAAGDAHVIRNAGGVVTRDALRSLAISQAMLGTREVMLIQHTACGLLGNSDEEIEAAIREAAGHAPDVPMRSFDDLERAVRDGVAAITGCAFMPHTDAVRGFVYEVETGRLREVS